MAERAIMRLISSVRSIRFEMSLSLELGPGEPGSTRDEGSFSDEGPTLVLSTLRSSR